MSKKGKVPSQQEIVAVQTSHEAIVAMMNLLSAIVGPKSAKRTMMMSLAMSAECCFPDDLDEFIEWVQNARAFMDGNRDKRPS